MSEVWLTKRELASELKISTRTIERLRFPCMQVGGQNRYMRSEVLAYLAGVHEEGGNVVPFPSNRTTGAAA